MTVFRAAPNLLRDHRHGFAPCAPGTPLRLAVVAAALLVSACAGLGGEPEMEASQDTYACKLAGERIVVRFVDQEARLLMPPDEHLVTLYQLPTGGGTRYSNGMMELRGATTNLKLTREDNTVTLTDCEPLKVPKKSRNPFALK